MVESRVRKSTIVVLCSTMTTTRIVHCEVEATVCLKSSYLIVQVDIGLTHAQVELSSPEWLRKEKGREHTTTFQITERGGAKRPKSYMIFEWVYQNLVHPGIINLNIGSLFR